MISLENIEKKIIKEKLILKQKSKNYKDNFLRIEKFIEEEVLKIQALKKNNSNIIPEINFHDLNNQSEKIVNEVKKRGCVVIKNVFENDQMIKMNSELESYIEDNNYYDDQRKKADIDQYFSDLKSGKPQIFGLYWSKPQVNIRQSLELNKVKTWLNHLWEHKDHNNNLFDQNSSEEEEFEIPAFLRKQKF